MIAENKHQLAESVLGHTKFDCAVPQLWLDAVVAETGCDYHTLLGGVVWNYGGKDCGIFGEPAPITNEAAIILAETTT